MGCRQVVSHRSLEPVFTGSNPVVPDRDSPKNFLNIIEVFK